MLQLNVFFPTKWIKIVDNLWRSGPACTEGFKSSNFRPGNPLIGYQR